ncbi:MAG: aldo/keto reductase family protein [Candidatus Hodarchaeales archaeon]|jgi:diketogulonate reductase-like aldo/keto reductase
MKKIKSHIIYGTAWKEDKTEKLTLKALNAGFNAIDTANQRKHYFEEGVGRAIASFLRSTETKREELFIQTKFTYKEGQDHRLPYDPKAEPAIQVRESIKSSLEHLQTDYIDSYVLHGPSARFGLSEVDWEVWKTMEELCSEGRVQRLGVSNINAEQLNLLLEKVKIKPSYVQNRCYARFGWDKEIREVCNKNNIVYQGFSLLTANREVLSNSKVIEISKKVNKTVEQIIFSFAGHIGMLPLTGTTNREHMDQDLESESISLTEEQITMLENISIN